MTTEDAKKSEEAAAMALRLVLEALKPLTAAEQRRVLAAAATFFRQ